MQDRACRCSEASYNLRSRNHGGLTHTEEGRAERRSEFVRKKSCGLAEQDFTAALFYYTSALPRTEQTAGSERCHVRGVRQFLIGDIEFDATRDGLPNHSGQVAQHAGQSLFSGVTS